MSTLSCSFKVFGQSEAVEQLMKTLTDRALEADQVHCAASAEFAGATFVDRPAAERIHSEGDPGRQLPP